MDAKRLTGEGVHDRCAPQGGVGRKRHPLVLTAGDGLTSSYSYAYSVPKEERPIRPERMSFAAGTG